MDIITATELITFDLENQNKGTDTQSLRQKVRNILSKNLNFKLKENLLGSQGFKETE